MNVSPRERTENVNLRVTPEEKKMLKMQAAALGMTVTGYLLGLAIGSVVGGEATKNGSEKEHPYT